MSESTQERGEGQTEAGMLTPENLEISQERRLITYKGSFLKLTANILTETIEDRRQRDDILKILNQKKKKLSNKISISGKLSSKMKGKLRYS